MISRVADLMDAQIGQIYVTPVVLDENVPEQRAGALLLKQINLLVASGRILMDAKAAGSDLQTYGKSMFDEGIGYLRMVLNGQFALRGALTLGDNPETPPNNAAVVNEDPNSLVKAFYENTMQGNKWSWPPVQPSRVAPYEPAQQYPVWPW